MNLRHFVLIGFAGTALFTGCAKKPPLHSAMEEPVPPKVSVSKASPVVDTAALHRGQLQSQMAETFKTIYFGFDKSDLTPDGRATCTSIGAFMKGEPGVTVRVEGNADERGTEMYNLALGDRRANMARSYLVEYGIDSSRISTISYGKEKPAVEGHDEAAWSKNRRDDFTPAL
jgi:peptidoglycan-associated lipoprotein